MQTEKQLTNNQELFGKYYDEFMPKVYRFIRYKVNDEQVTEDLTSIVFEKALDKFSMYSSNKASFSTWIFSITRNTLIDYYRTNKTQQQVSLDEVTDMPSQDLSPQEMAEKNAEQESLRKSLLKLSEDDQEIIRLKFAGEFNNRQIAKMLGLSESNVGIRLFRALKKLREGFNESWNGQ